MRPEGWNEVKKESEHQQMFFTEQEDRCYEAGADAMLEGLKGLHQTIYAQLRGVRIERGKTTWYSMLDNNIDALKKILGYPEDES